MPAAASGLESVPIVQVLPPRVSFHVQATEIWSPSASLVVVEAWSVSFVFGEAGLNVGAVSDGGLFTRVVAVAVLSPAVLSFGEETVALFVIEPAVPGAV